MGKAKINRDIRNKIYRRDGGRCLVCGTDKNLTIDHIVPLSRGGMNVETNYQTLCASDNLKKGNKAIDYRSGTPVRLTRKEYAKCYKWKPETKAKQKSMRPMKILLQEIQHLLPMNNYTGKTVQHNKGKEGKNGFHY